MLATKKEHLAIVEALLDAKADPNIIDQVGSSDRTNHLIDVMYRIAGIFRGRNFCQHCLAKLIFARTVKVAASLMEIITTHQKFMD